MWRCATLRERRTSTRRAIAQTGKRFQHALALQLDYYMSPQFAGVASALVNDTYKAKGIDISFLPTCPVGHEQANMRKFKDENPSFVTMGSVEQNIFSPTLAASPHLKTTAVAAMFRKSPLCIASLKDPTEETLKIGTHEDTVDMMKRIFPTHKVIASPRATKNTDLMDGNIGATQAYTTTEVPALQRALKENDKSLFSTPLEGFGGAKLGYSQVIFTADECLKGDQRDVVRAFCEATFDGWKEAIRNPKQAAEMVADAKKMLGLDDESNDHWHPSFDFEVEMLQNCNDHVKETFEGDRYGVINPNRWNDANSWILNDGKPTKNFGLDPDLWHPNSKLLSGNSLSNTIMEDAKASATFFKETHGRKPSLAVVTVGDLERYKHGERRLEIFSNSTNSWFSKTTTGLANGFDVQEINLDSTITTDELLSQIYALGDNVDGIQLMWPLPDHIDSTKVYSAIDVSKDVDGIHYVGQREIGNKNAYPPVTPAAAMALMNEFDVKLKGKRVLVVGRSRIVGSPLAHMIREQGAAVTVAHSEIPGDMMKELVEEAQVIVACAGQPGLIKADWINQAQVINIGSTFDSELEALRSDIEGDIEKHASRFSPVPGGVGPISVAMLLKNVVKAAWDNMSLRGSALRNGWNQKPESLTKTFHFSNYTSALEGAKKVDELSTIMDHHANMKFTHNCVNGVDLEMEFFTYEAKRITSKDYDAAQVIDMALGKDEIEMERYTYNLREESISKWPANPRGSSKLLKYEGNGNVTYLDNFSESFPSLVEGCHLVFNDSRVLDARLFVTDSTGSKVELMLLDLGSIDVGGCCKDTKIQAMIRTEHVTIGSEFEVRGGGRVEIVEVKGIWEEDDKSDGNGTECLVRINSEQSVEDYLGNVGSVPIPPYLHRSSEVADKEAYNNTYATNAGSVAAPTAGLHFTDQVMKKIGDQNCSYLSLHVGAGTFKPVMVKDARDHEMHAEVFAVSVREIRSIIGAIKANKPLVAVGTTSSRTLESLFWCGVKRIRGLDDGTTDDGSLVLRQFDWIPLKVGVGRKVTRTAALEALITGLDHNDTIQGKTSLMIAPPFYDFMVVDHLVTNFHAPDSTLMLLVSAFIKDSKGSRITKIYEDAQDRGYRFLSYGDVCFFKNPIESK